MLLAEAVVFYQRAVVLVRVLAELCFSAPPHLPLPLLPTIANAGTSADGAGGVGRRMV